jgi:hypothetical protein
MARYVQTLQTFFPNKKIRVDVGLRSQEAKKLGSIRNEVTRAVSDFISEELKKGGFGGKLSSKQKNAFRKAAGTKGDPSPDALIDLDEFEGALRDIGKPMSLSESAVLKSNVQRITTAETKVSGVGSNDSIELTSFQIGKGREKDAKKIQAARGSKSNISGQAAVDLLFSRPFKQYKDRLFIAAKNKLENLTLVSTIDPAGKAGLDVRFIANPLDKVPLTKANILKYFDIRFRPRSGKVDQFRLTISTKAAYTQELKKQSTDITTLIQRAQLKAVGGQTFGEGFLGYIGRQLSQGERKTKDIGAFLAIGLAFAREFDAKPFTVKTKINTPNPQVSLLTTVAAKNQRKKEKETLDSGFISGIQLSALVQKRLGQTMEKSGMAEPPDLKERTGRFRRSVQVIPNYRRAVMRYLYNPLYDGNLQYGYRPDLQVAEATRDVVQAIFKRRFAIVRA